jgi:SAM-dependent methyltransferase
MKPTRIAERLARLGLEQRELVGKMLAAKRREGKPGVQAFEEEALRSFHSPAERTKTGTKKFYNAINQQLDHTIFGACSAFLNYGYADDGSPRMSRVELPSYMVNRNSVQLVLEVIADCKLNAKRVLDVGCGRGGTLAVVSQFFHASRKVGLDLSSAAIAYCQKAHCLPDTSFQEGDAEQLPFDDEEFDVVLSVESSHSYPDIGAFYEEVRRVVTPGGYFLYTDVFPLDCFDGHQHTLRRMGFVIEQERDITRNVLLSCRQTAEIRLRAFTACEEQSVITDFLSTPGSTVFEEMECGRAAYRILRIKRS